MGCIVTAFRGARIANSGETPCESASLVDRIFWTAEVCAPADLLGRRGLQRGPRRSVFGEWTFRARNWFHAVSQLPDRISKSNDSRLKHTCVDAAEIEGSAHARIDELHRFQSESLRELDAARVRLLAHFD